MVMKFEMNKKNKIKKAIDTLTLEMLDLIQQRIQCIVDIEKRVNEGSLLLAKARYFNGTQTVSSSQLPTEKSAEFNALCKVIQDNVQKSQGKNWKLQKSPIDKKNGYFNPMNWFGVLVSRCLQISQGIFQSTIDLVVEYANIQSKLNIVMDRLNDARNIVESL